MARLTINLVGTLCTGKSWIASQYVAGHTGWSHLSIDAYRDKYRTEAAAWRMLSRHLVDRDFVILETSGVAKRLKSVLSKSASIYTVALVAPEKLLLKRLEKRGQKHKFEYEHLDPRKGLVWIRNNLRRMSPVPIDETIDTSNPEYVTYKMFVSAIDRAILLYT